MCVSGGAECFQVDPETGVVRTTCTAAGSGPGALRNDHEYEIGVSAIDLNGHPQPQKSITHSLKVLVGERDPQFYESLFSASVPEHAPKQFEYVCVIAIICQFIVKTLSCCHHSITSNIAKLFLCRYQINLRASRCLCDAVIAV